MRITNTIATGKALAARENAADEKRIIRISAPTWLHSYALPELREFPGDFAGGKRILGFTGRRFLF
jgi:hypothetical protein